MSRRALVLVFAALACACDEPPRVFVCEIATEVPDATRALGCQRDRDLLGYRESPFSSFAHTNTIGVVFDRQNDVVWFLDTEKWWLHFDFVYFVLEGHPESERGSSAYMAARVAFNAETYFSSGRRYLVAKLVEYRDQARMTFELATGDNAGADMIVDAFDRVRADIFDGERLLFRPTSSPQEQMIPAIGGRIPIVTSDQLFAGQTYQPLNAAVGYGTLVFRKASQLGGQRVLPTDIVVLDRPPNDITVVSGIITEEFQTPLSHVNILAKNRGTPNMALRGAMSDDLLRGYEGELVRLEVTGEEWTIAPATLEQAQAFWDALRPDVELAPAHDLSRVAIVDLAQAGITEAAQFGALVVGVKAANFAEMMRIVPPLPMPRPAFAIPFARFDQHMTAHGLWGEVEAIMADLEAGMLSAEALDERLFALRLAIYRAPLDEELAAALDVLARATWGAKHIRFRSSTNVEDLPGFSGAGLYTSLGRDADAGPAALADAVKVVWASAFNPAAFFEREWHRVDHRNVMMAVLMHAAYVDEQMNGVAVSSLDALRPGWLINAQLGEVSVTNATGEATPEQLVWYRFVQQVEILTRSSLTGGAPLLTDEQVRDLAGLLDRVEAHFRPLWCVGPCSTDVEWKITAAGEIQIKQARPLHIGGAP